MLHIPALWYFGTSVTYPPWFRRVKLVVIPPRFIKQQYLWNISIQPAVGCYNSWANLRCSGCNPLGGKLLWNRSIIQMYMITRLIWTPMSSAPKKADKLSPLSSFCPLDRDQLHAEIHEISNTHYPHLCTVVQKFNIKDIFMILLRPNCYFSGCCLCRGWWWRWWWHVHNSEKQGFWWVECYFEQLGQMFHSWKSWCSM